MLCTIANGTFNEERYAYLSVRIFTKSSTKQIGVPCLEKRSYPCLCLLFASHCIFYHIRAHI